MPYDNAFERGNHSSKPAMTALMSEREELLALAERIDTWTPSHAMLVFIARERRMIADALRGYSGFAQGCGMRAALEFIRDGYERGDISHVDYRVGAYKAALAALEGSQFPSTERGAATSGV